MSHSVSTTAAPLTAQGGDRGTQPSVAVPASSSTSEGKSNNVITSSNLTQDKKRILELEQELTRAQLRIAQLLASTHPLPQYQSVLERLDATDRAFHRAATEARYTQMALAATHDALREEVIDCLARVKRVTAAGTNSGEEPHPQQQQRMEWAIDEMAIRSGARQLLRDCNAYRVNTVQHGGTLITEVKNDSRMI